MALIATVLLTAGGDAAPPAATAAGHLVEIRTADGSVLRTSLAVDALGVVTRYGTLRVPIADVQRIEFGLHPPIEIARSIDASLKLLGSAVAAERDQASADMRKAGHYARPALKLLSSNADAEVKRRAVDLLTHIEAHTSPALLKIGAEDRIQTGTCLILGRIVNATLPVRSALLGELKVRLEDLRSLQARGAPEAVELDLDAAIHGDGQWMKTGIRVDGSLRPMIAAAGHVDLWPQSPGQYTCGPKGHSQPGKGGAFNAGALIGRIGEKGRSFLVGERLEDLGGGDEGELYLRIEATNWNVAAAGSYHVRIHAEPR